MWELILVMLTILSAVTLAMVRLQLIFYEVCSICQFQVAWVEWTIGCVAFTLAVMIWVVLTIVLIQLVLLDVSVVMELYCWMESAYILISVHVSERILRNKLLFPWCISCSESITHTYKCSHSIHRVIIQYSSTAYGTAQAQHCTRTCVSICSH